MAFSEKLQFLIDVDGTRAIKGFKDVGDSASTHLGAGGTASSAFGSKLDDLAAKSPLVGKAFQKLGTDGAGVASMLGSALPAAGLAAGAGLAAFGVKAVTDFQNLALSVLDFQRASGATAEEASRLVVVLDDYGIAADVGAKAIQRLARNVANAPEKFAEFGIEIAKNKDGTTDLNQTLLNVAEAYQGSGDAATKASIAAALFGARGGKELIPLLEKGADGAEGLAAAFEEISGQQIFSQDQLDQAQTTDLALDRLADAANELSLAIGSGLSPVVAEVSGKLSGLIDISNKALGPIGGLDTAIGFMADSALKGGPVIKVATDGLRGLGEAAFGAEKQAIPLDHLIGGLTEKSVALTGSTNAVEQALGLEATASANAAGALVAQEIAAKNAKAASDELAAAAKAEADRHTEAAAAITEQTNALRGAADATFAAQDAADRYTAILADESAKERDVVRAAADLADANVRVAEETAKADGATFGATQKLDTFNGSMITAAAQASGPTRTAMIDYIAKVNEIPASKASEIQALIDQGKLAEAHAALNEAAEARDAAITAEAHTAEAENALNHLVRARRATILAQINAGDRPTGRAHGGPVSAGMPFVVGEQGPELFVPSSNGRVLSHGASMGAMASPGASINLTVNAGLGANGNQIGNEVVRILKQWERSNGPGWRQ